MDRHDHTRDDWVVLFVAYCETHGIHPPHETLRQAAERLYGSGGATPQSPIDGVRRLRVELAAGMREVPPTRPMLENGIPSRG